MDNKLHVSPEPEVYEKMFNLVYELVIVLVVNGQENPRLIKDVRILPEAFYVDKVETPRFASLSKKSSVMYR